MTDRPEDAIKGALTAASFHINDEAELHRAIGRVLTEAGIAHEHEVSLAPRERIDFLAGDVGLEVKVDGTIASIFRQLQRYAQSPRVRTLLLVTPRLRYGIFDGRMFANGKRLDVVRIVGGFL